MISERVYTDREGKIFIPMNVEGNSYHEDFMTTPKILVLGGVILWLVYLIMSLVNRGAAFGNYIATIIMWLLVSQFLIRYVVFEEKYYYKMYKEMKKEKVTTPSTFWRIASLKDTDNGCLITYIDGKVGYLVRLEKDTITGKPKEFMEEHYDGVSDFYKELNKRKYNYIQANVMEIAGKDERLKELDQLVYKDDNRNLNKLMQYQVGYIKNVTRRALYETDYFLIYTKSLNRLETMTNDIDDCVSHLLDGAYNSYAILDTSEITEMVKEMNGVKYFNPTDATLRMFNREGAKLAAPFRLRGVEYADGEIQEINSSNEAGLKNIIVKMNNNVEIKTTIKEALEIKQNKKEILFTEEYDTSGINEEYIGEDEKASDLLLSEINSIYDEDLEDKGLGDVASASREELALGMENSELDDEIIDF